MLGQGRSRALLVVLGALRYSEQAWPQHRYLEGLYSAHCCRGVKDRWRTHGADHYLNIGVGDLYGAYCMFSFSKFQTWRRPVRAWQTPD